MLLNVDTVTGTLTDIEQGRLSPLKTLEQDPLLPLAPPLVFPSHPSRPSPVLSLCTSFRGMNPLIPSPSLPCLCT